MPRVKVNANELVGTDVDFVSLVKRGANRIPFRITKEDTDMPLDLHKIGSTLFRKAETTPKVVAAIVKTGTDMAEVARMFKDAGLNPKDFQKTEGDTVTTVALPDAEQTENTSVIKMSDDIALVVTGIEKGFDEFDFEGSSFAEVLKVHGHYMSMVNAMDAFSEVARKSLHEAESPGDAASRLSKAADDFRNYVVALTSSLPEHAFKMEQAIAKAENGTGAGAEAGKGTGTSQAASEDDASNKNSATDQTSSLAKESDAKDKDKKGKKKPGMDEDEDEMEKGSGKDHAKKANGLPDPQGYEPGDPDGFAASPADSEEAKRRAAADDARSTQNGGTGGSSIPDGNAGLSVRKNAGDEKVGQPEHGNKLPEHQSGAGAQQPDEDEDRLTKAELTQVTDALAALTKSVEALSGLTQKVDDMGAKVDDAATRARKAEDAVNGTVFNEPGGTDGTKVAKADGPPAPPPLIDTAISSHRAA